MAISEKSRVRLEAIDARLARLRAARDRLAAQASVAERRRETRRKIVLGGTILAALEHEGVPALRHREALRQWLDRQLTRPQDRSAFDLPVAAAMDDTDAR